jgi:hypothetical protein
MREYGETLRALAASEAAERAGRGQYGRDPSTLAAARPGPFGGPGSVSSAAWSGIIPANARTRRRLFKRRCIPGRAQNSGFTFSAGY